MTFHLILSEARRGEEGCALAQTQEKRKPLSFVNWSHFKVHVVEKPEDGAVRVEGTNTVYESTRRLYGIL